jgi:hypothetical protein
MGRTLISKREAAQGQSCRNFFLGISMGGWDEGKRGTGTSEGRMASLKQFPVSRNRVKHHRV